MSLQNSSTKRFVRVATPLAAILMVYVATSGNAFAEGVSFADACNKVNSFFQRFETILRVASISIVTIAVIFSGYQIAFAHKRLSDVAPVLIGGLLIGGAATIAGWFVGDLNADTESGASVTCEDSGG